MPTAEAINALLRAGEGETLEFKEQFGADVIETAVAFANTHGGTILIGVRDDAHITGTPFGKEALRDYVNRIATATEPAVVPAGRLQQLIHILDHRIIAGTVIDQVEETMAFMQKNLHVRVEITGAPARQEIWDYPLVALREALINAICHRDYGDTADIQIKIFENSLHIWSPGTLPHGVSVPDLLSPTHPSRPRNKLIAQVFFDLGLIERYGGGIQRILAACESAGLPPPELANFQGGFRMVFKQVTADQVAPQVTPQVTPQVEQLLTALKAESTREFLMAQLGLRDREHFRTGYLVPALEAGLVEMTLPDKPTSRLQKYRLTEAGRQMQAMLQPGRSA